jgi:hypothetical protein
MDPNLFHLDWERTFEALVAIIVLAFFVERACALVFESRWYIRLFEEPRVAMSPDHLAALRKEPVGERDTAVTTTVEVTEDHTTAVVTASQPMALGRLYPMKELVAFLLAAGVCVVWDFDAISMVLLREHTHLVGRLITAAVIAGGSKASIALFHKLMNVRSNAERERQLLKKEVRP